MSSDRERRLQDELGRAVDLLDIVDHVAAELMAENPDLEALEAVKVLLVRQLRRIDDLLLDLTRDRLDEERRGLGQ